MITLHFRLYSVLLLGLLLSLWGSPAVAQSPRADYLLLTDGTRLTGKLTVKDPERVVYKAAGSPAVNYKPEQVAYFVVGRDSFVVLRNFDMVLDEEVQSYRQGFAQVLFNRAGYEAYAVYGRTTTTGYNPPVHYDNGLATSGGGVAVGIRRYHTMIFRSPRNARWIMVPPRGRDLTNLALQYVGDNASLADVARSPGFTQEQFLILLGDWLRVHGQ